MSVGNIATTIGNTRATAKTIAAKLAPTPVINRTSSTGSPVAGAGSAERGSALVALDQGRIAPNGSSVELGIRSLDVGGGDVVTSPPPAEEGGLFDSIVGGVSDAVGGIGDAIGDAFSGIGDFISGIGDTIGDIGSGIIDVVEGVGEFIGDAVQGAVDFVGGAEDLAAFVRDPAGFVIEKFTDRVKEAILADIQAQIAAEAAGTNTNADAGMASTTSEAETSEIVFNPGDRELRLQLLNELVDKSGPFRGVVEPLVEEIKASITNEATLSAPGSEGVALGNVLLDFLGFNDDQFNAIGVNVGPGLGAIVQFNASAEVGIFFGGEGIGFYGGGGVSTGINAGLKPSLDLGRGLTFTRVQEGGREAFGRAAIYNFTISFPVPTPTTLFAELEIGLLVDSKDVESIGDAIRAGLSPSEAFEDFNVIGVSFGISPELATVPSFSFTVGQGAGGIAGVGGDGFFAS